MKQAVAELSDEESAVPIWEGYFGFDDQGPYIVGGQCPRCTRIVLEPRRICPHCHEDVAMASVPVGRQGVLYSATVIHQAPEGFAAPFRVGYVDVEDGIRVFAHIDNGPQRPAIGDPVTLSIRPMKTLDDGTVLHGPYYKADEPEVAR